MKYLTSIFISFTNKLIDMSEINILDLIGIRKRKQTKKQSLLYERQAFSDHF